MNKPLVIFLLSISIPTLAQEPLPVDVGNSLETELLRELPNSCR